MAFYLDVLLIIVECYCFYRGVTIGYGSPRTLSDTSVRNCNGDMKELRPTVMAGVPSVWETIRKGVLAKVGLASAGKQRVLSHFIVNYYHLDFQGCVEP